MPGFIGTINTQTRKVVDKTSIGSSENGLINYISRCGIDKQGQAKSVLPQATKRLFFLLFGRIVLLGLFLLAFAFLFLLYMFEYAFC